MKLRKTLEERKRLGKIPIRKFVWFPIMLEDGGVVWLEYVYETTMYDAIGSWKMYEKYKPPLGVEPSKPWPRGKE